MSKRIIILIICTVFVFQCRGLLLANEKVEGGKKVEKIEEDEKEVVKKEEGGKKENIVAIVNGEKIFREQLDRRLSVFKRMNQEITRSTQLLIVDQLTRDVLLRQFINKQDIEVSNEEIKGELEKIKYFFKSNSNTSELDLEEVLESRGSNINALEEKIKGTIALSKYLDKVISDDEKRNYFDANENSFNGEKVKASHILVDTRSIKTEDELRKAKQKIENIKKEIDGGVDIAKLAKKYSDCPSKEKGGDIGFFERRGSIVEPFAKVAFSMKVGDVSEPVKTQFGYHIIKVTDRKEGKNVNYEDVKEKVDFVFMEIKKGNLINSLIEKSEIEVLL